MRKSNLRNLAIIAHVDHGKTTLVDHMLKQGGVFQSHQIIADRVMDSMDQERERGITILAKNTAIRWGDIKLNIVDTPGHVDFGGEVERSLHMVDGALLLVDSSEGPLPQTRFVVQKALAQSLPIILVINKIDRKDARVDEVVNEVFDLFIELDANEQQLEFPILYTIAREGIAHRELGDDSTDLKPLFEAIVNHIPGPEADDDATPQFLVTNLDHDPYVGQLAHGRLFQGSLELAKDYGLCKEDKSVEKVRFTALYSFTGLERTKVERIEAGDILALAGIEGICIGDTISDFDNPKPLPRIHVDEPTVSMRFMVNNGPFAGKEGTKLTSRQIKDRLERETLRNVALVINPTERADAFEVRGRGELQLGVLIETMRREGFELCVSRPKVITREGKGGKIEEPFEDVFLDVPDEFVGVVTEKLSIRKGRMTNLVNNGTGRVRLEFHIPSRGLIGFRSEFLTDTKGTGVMNMLSTGYEAWAGVIPQRTSGALICDRAGKVTANACFMMEERGVLFIRPPMEIYQGMIAGERNRSGDLEVNITKEKKLSNMRSSTSDVLVTLSPPRRMSLDRAIEYISDDEIVEITPQSVRLRKFELDPTRRERARKKLKAEKEAEAAR